MTKFKDKYRVESARLRGWDYASAGWYFVTICTHQRACVVLQPVTPAGSVTARVGAARMLALGRLAEERIADVRVLPQLHPVMGVR